MTTPNVYGFASPEDFYATVKGAQRANREHRTPPPFTTPADGVNTHTSQVYVQLTGPVVPYDRDRRHIYPAMFWLRNTESTSSVEDWESFDDLGIQESNPCIAITPNGEVLRQKVRYEGRVIGRMVVVDPTPPELEAELVTRFSVSSGELLFAEAHGVTVGELVTVTWTDGQQTLHTVDTVTTYTLTFSGGRVGDEPVLPDEGTAITLTQIREVEVTAVHVDCTDAVEIIRTTMTRNDDGDYLGYIQEYDVGTKSWVDGEEVWVKNAN